MRRRWSYRKSWAGKNLPHTYTMARFEVSEDFEWRGYVITIITDNLRPQLRFSVTLSHELIVELSINPVRLCDHLIYTARQFEELLSTPNEIRTAEPLFLMCMQRAYHEGTHRCLSLRLSDHRTTGFVTRSDYLPITISGALSSAHAQLTWPPEESVRSTGRDAEAKAQSLLLRFLSSEQQQSLSANEYFDVQGADGRRYRLSKGHYNNITVLSPLGTPTEEVLCAGPVGVPLGDHLLAQKLLLESDPHALLSKANRRGEQTNVGIISSAFLEAMRTNYNSTFSTTTAIPLTIQPNRRR